MLAGHIRSIHLINSKEYYETFIAKSCCEECSSKTRFRSLREGFFQFCSVSCASKSKLVVKKKQKTMMKNHGFISVFSKHEIQVLSERKRKKTMSIKYGSECAFGNTDIRDKCKATFMKNFGVKHPMQNAEYFLKHSKTGYGFKDAVLNGEKIKIQGYEHLFLERLSEFGFSEKEISKQVPAIPYSNGEHRYHPDFFSKEKNTIIEIKSLWTYCGKQKYKELTHQKIDAAVVAGYNVLLIVFDKKKQVHTVLKF